MPPVKLTDIVIRNLKTPVKTMKLFDGGGLYLEATPKGGKYWRMKYRMHGKEKRLAFGIYPDVPLRLARERREKARRLLAEDIDPGERKKELNDAKLEQLSNTFIAIAEEWHAKQSNILGLINMPSVCGDVLN